MYHDIYEKKCKCLHDLSLCLLADMCSAWWNFKYGSLCMYFFFTVMFVLGTAAHLKQSFVCFTITEPFWQAQRNGLLPCIVSHLSKVKWSDPWTELSLRKKGQCVLMDLGRMQSETCFHCLRQHQKEARWFMLLVYCQVAFAEAWLPRFLLKKPSPEDRPFLLDPHVLFLQLLKKCGIQAQITFLLQQADYEEPCASHS